MTLMVMADWKSYLMDVNGAFLKGEFKEHEQIYMKIPQGFEEYYEKDTTLLLQKTIYRLKQAACAFWRELVQSFTYMGYHCSMADLCLYYA